MKYIIEHYGPAILAVTVFIALGVLIAGMLVSNGAIATQFTGTVTNFFSQMKDATGI